MDGIRTCLICGRQLRIHEKLWCPPCSEKVLHTDFRGARRATPFCSYDGIGADGKIVRGRKCYCALPEKN